MPRSTPSLDISRGTGAPATGRAMVDGMIVFTCEGCASVLVVDPATGQIRDTYTVDFDPPDKAGSFDAA
jgi:hypothetical protein